MSRSIGRVAVFRALGAGESGGVGADEFAAAVSRLEPLLGVPPDEREIAEELKWSRSAPALVALGQEARSRGLVRIVYDACSGERRYSPRHETGSAAASGNRQEGVEQ